MHEGWAPATRDQVFVDFSGSPRTLFSGCYTPCTRVARPLQVNQPPIESRADDLCSRSVVFERKALN